MARKHEFIKLKEEEEKELRALLNKGKHSSGKLTRARILLLNHDGHQSDAIPSLLNCSLSTVYNILKHYKSGGLESALSEKPRTGRPPIYSGVERAKITGLACSNPPEGHSKWVLRLLADKAVELKCIDCESISYSTIRRILKKTI